MSEKVQILDVTDATFKAFVEGAPAPVLVQFHAAWCLPCKTLTPIVNSLARELGDQLIAARMDVDSNSLIIKQYGIKGVPTMLVFKAGKVVEHVKGVVGKDRLRAALLKHIGSGAEEKTQ